MKLFQRLINSINHNTVLFISGLLGVAHETLIQHAERPTLLILFAAMMGLPAFLTPANPGDMGFMRHPHKGGEEDVEKHEELPVAEGKNA